MTIQPRALTSPNDARALLLEIAAPARLLRHGELVAEAAEEILRVVTSIAPGSVDSLHVLLGAWLHDAGKAVHRSELEQPGHSHEAAGEKMLLECRVDARVARMCRTHAQWRTTPDVAFEELLVALADSLWKGKRDRELEERVVDALAAIAKRDRWELFTLLDDMFEKVAAGAQPRLERSVQV